MKSLSDLTVNDSPAAIFTAGHSTRSLHDLLLLLQGAGIRNLADVRSFPGSRRFPHFNQDVFRGALEKESIRYYHFQELGGRRKLRWPDPRFGGWKSAGFRAYAAHMLTEEFRAGMTRLLEVSAEGRTAILCAEATPWRCHRQLIADFLVGLGRIPVLHILAPGRRQPHRLTPFAVIEPEEILYPDRPGGESLPFPDGN
ncbi:MAG: DUF488 domain-containing protein [Acidobacteria bacterium]|nr:DUF488 domain-containing protein [Acidobacteriota bacterium]